MQSLITLVRRPRLKINRIPAFALTPFLILWMGCAHFIANYDPITYKSLTDLKAEIVLFLEKVDPVKPYTEYAPQFEDLKLKLEKVYEYEKGKKKNDDTIAQITEVRTMLHDLVALYKEQNKLNAFYLDEKKKQLATALDIVITTENSKTKGN